MIRKVFVTGANGVLGRSAVTALMEAGHEVVGLVRHDGAAATLENLGAEPRWGDLFDHASLVAGMRGCDAVAHLAGKVPLGAARLLPGSLREAHRIRTLGTRVLTGAAQEAGIDRIVQRSLSLIYADHGDEWIDEDAIVEVSRVTEPVVVAEEHMMTFTDAGGAAVCLRMGVVTGTDANSMWLLRRARAGRKFAAGRPGSWVHLVHPHDAGTAVVHALTAAPGVYNVGAEPTTRAEYAETFARVAGRSEARPVPNWIMRLGSDRLESLNRSQRVSSRRFTAATGWRPAFPSLTSEWIDDRT